MAALVGVGMAGRCLGQQHQNLKPVVLSTQWAGVPMKKNKKMVSPGRKGQWCFEGDLAFLASSGFRVKKPWISSVFVRAASQSSSFSQLASPAQEPLAGTGGTYSLCLPWTCPQLYFLLLEFRVLQYSGGIFWETANRGLKRLGCGYSLHLMPMMHSACYLSSVLLPFAGI